MTKKEFQNRIKDRVVILDGATGSNLQRRGMPAGVCPELWVMENREVLQQLQKEYLQAGSEIVYAPTFSGNRIKLAEYGLEDRLAEINGELVRVSRDAVGEGALVSGDITMTGAQLEPMGELTFQELVDIYKEQIRAIVEAGVDLIGVETMMSLQETRAALLAAKEVQPDLPVTATLSFGESGNTLYGVSAESAVVTLQALGADAVGLNCSVGPDKMTEIVKRMKEVAHVPLMVKPNAGLPRMGTDGQTVYDMDADDFSEYMASLVKSGAQLIGGCCGTSPEYIRKLTARVDGLSPAAVQTEGSLYLADERQIYPFTEGQILELGEGIDYTKNGELLDEYRDEIFDTAQDLAFDLQDEEADALLFSAAGLEDEGEILLAAVTETAQTVGMPVVIATGNPSAAAQVLAGYSGVAAVMPLCDGEQEWEAMKTVIRRYGACLVTIDKEIRCC